MVTLRNVAVLVLLLASASASHAQQLKRSGDAGNGSTISGPIPKPLILKLQVDTKTALVPSWGIKSTAETQDSVGGPAAKSIRLRYFAGASAVPAHAAATIEASANKDFHPIFRTVTLTPNHGGIIEAGAALSLPAPYGTIVIGNTATWYLRMKGHLLPSNMVTVVMVRKAK